MSYKYNPYRDSFTHIDDEESITVYMTRADIPVHTCPVVYLADECIDRIADAVARKLREKSDG